MDYARAAALAFYTEVLEEALPDHDPQEVIFRLVLSVLAHTRQGAIWMPVTYFALWMPRLLGWLPDLTHCAVCDEPLTGRAAFFHSEVDGLLCETHRRPGARILSAESLALAPTAELPPWPPARAADLRRFALITLERHLERRLHSADALRRLGG